MMNVEMLARATNIARYDRLRKFRCTKSHCILMDRASRQ